MGSFAITYDDFTGGHYMGNKSAETPANTWTGTNVLLNSQGELIPASTALFQTFDDPAGLSNGTIHNLWIDKNSGYTYAIITYDNGGSPSVYSTYAVNFQSDGNVASSTSSFLLTGVVGGAFNNRAFGVYSPTDLKYFYVDRRTGATQGEIRSTNFVTDTLVSSALVTESIDSLTLYKFRLLAWQPGENKFFYSDPTRTSWSLTDYYELAGDIYSLIPRSNDLVAITSEGVYSITGVLGSSVNIQQIGPPNELTLGMEATVANGRSLVFVSQNDKTSPVLSEWLGSTSTEVARFRQSDINEYTSNQTAAHVDLNVVHNGQTVVVFDSGVMYLRSPSGSWARLYCELPQQNTVTNMKIATEYVGFFQMFGSGPVQEAYAIFAMYDGFADETKFYKYKTGGFLPSGTYEAYSPFPFTSPFSATVKLSEYWHQRPMIVREVLVEAVYDRDDLLKLNGNATVAVSVKPVGAVDYTVNQTSALTSSTQTYTTSIASVTADNSRVLHRFRTDDAIRGYGFYPQITWQGCRIRRVIAVCED